MITIKQSFKTMKLLSLMYLWTQVNTTRLYSQLWWFILFQYVDIPYTLILTGAFQQTLGIIAHHTWVFTVYHNLRFTPPLLANTHIYTYMFHHTIGNIPYQNNYMKYILTFTWSLQVFVPFYYYIVNSTQVLQNVLLIINYHTLLLYCIYVMSMGVFKYFRSTHDLSILISFKDVNEDEYNIKKIL
jgi:hypothetical protein